MSVSFPILRVARLDEEGGADRASLSISKLSGLGRRLEASAFETPAAPFIACGWIPLSRLHTPGLFLIEETRLRQISYWCSQIGARGFSSVLPVSPERLEDDEGISEIDLPILLGHGVVVASRGLSGRPLVGMELGRLREELHRSRERLSEICGYPVGTLAPATTVGGRAFDGLVEREARRAGYRVLLGPGGVTDVETIEPKSILGYRVPEEGENASALRDWFLGRGFSRQSSRLRRIASAPRALLNRLAQISDGE